MAQRIKETGAERKQRIEQVGAFGRRRTQVVKDKTKYSRKQLKAVDRSPSVL
jgi:hypothetical protein